MKDEVYDLKISKPQAHLMCYLLYEFLNTKQEDNTRLLAEVLAETIEELLAEGAVGK